jgi:exopolyphosphatase/guanosine-5'-triphosphate,3'-diphosphate pyrophosphatase
MLVARLSGGELSIVDRLREAIRLSDGMDADKNISPAARNRALECLKRFGQRVRDMPHGTVRAVGTNTLRSAHNAAEFIAEAEQALGHPIEVIAGIEEARLIYLGVAHSLAADEQRRLVMDIGGGSTELIIGQGFTPLRMESLYMGCVNLTRRFFPNGAITAEALARAELTARIELEPLEQAFPRIGWDKAIGASGTIRAVDRVISEAGWSKGGITLEALKKVAAAMLEAGHTSALPFKGLNAERADVFPGGLAVLLAAFKALGIKHMQVADGALREGLLHDLIGRIHHEDVRSRSVANLAVRYHIDNAQAARVEQTVLACAAQVQNQIQLDADSMRLWLGWAAQLHEIGLDIAHSHYNRHGAYVVCNADLPGFSRQEQTILAEIIRYHRRKLNKAAFAELQKKWQSTALWLTALLRLSVLLHRGRNNEALPALALNAGKRQLQLRFPAGWLNEHPLTRADLEQEAVYLRAVEFELKYE